MTPAGKSSREVSRRSHSDFSSPRICEQSGRLAVVPTPRDAGGTTLYVCVAIRDRSAGLCAAFGVLGTVVCCGMELGLDAELEFDAGVAADGVGEVCAAGGGAAGDGDVLG